MVSGSSHNKLCIILIILERLDNVHELVVFWDKILSREGSKKEGKLLISGERTSMIFSCDNKSNFSIVIRFERELKISCKAGEKKFEKAFVCVERAERIELSRSEKLRV
jgi:hypothetical protein